MRAKYGELVADDTTGEVVGVAGRVVFFRNTGKLCFATLQSGDGERIQAMVSLAEVGEESLERWKEYVDLGDHVFVSGEVISSRRGELSILVDGVADRGQGDPAAAEPATPSSATRPGCASATST